MSNPANRIILPLDVDNETAALRLVESLAEHVGVFKVGLELVNAAGIDVIDRLYDAGARRIFYDAKLHDIPNTVAGAVRAAVRHRIWMINFHASGGFRMMKAGVDALPRGADAPLLIGVTLLTSATAEELKNEMRVDISVEDYVVSLAKLTQAAGANGVVASPHEVPAIREKCGTNFVIVTPGVRPANDAVGDQRRTATPAEAIRLGSDYLVIGRPIAHAPNPADAAQRIAAEIDMALN